METEKIKNKVIKMNKVLEHVKITGFVHCRNVIQAAMRIVREEVDKCQEEKGTILKKKDSERNQ